MVDEVFAVKLNGGAVAYFNIECFFSVSLSLCLSLSLSLCVSLSQKRPVMSMLSLPFLLSTLSVQFPGGWKLQICFFFVRHGCVFQFCYFLLFFNFQLFSEHVFSVFPTCFNRGAVSNFHVLMVYPRNLLTTPLKSRIFPKSA